MFKNEFCFINEKEIEQLWEQQKGIDPKTGKMWLTPRSERLCKQVLEIWGKETYGSQNLKMRNINMRTEH